MGMLSNPAFGPRVALIYVTAGALIDVWTLVYYFTVARDRELNNVTWFWLSGLFLTGLTLVVLGLVLGPLGRAARKAELPPAEATHSEAAIQAKAASTPHPVMPGAMPAPGATQPTPAPAPQVTYPVPSAPIIAPQG
jgi:hypothetical protein